jgi:DNA-binding NarL/FixJ family response regulator
VAAIPLQIVTSPAPSALHEDFHKLGPRERAVLVLVARGYSAPEVGTRLGISPKTVHTYKSRIQEKLGLSHRTHYVQFALALGLLAESQWQRSAPARQVHGGPQEHEADDNPPPMCAGE